MRCGQAAEVSPSVTAAGYGARPMLTHRRRVSLHHTEGGWFSATWHFSFDDYDDPENTWFGDLRVFNDDTLVPGAVWPMPPHRDIACITYVAERMLEHAASPGTGVH